MLRLVLASVDAVAGGSVVLCVACDVVLGEGDVEPNMGKTFNLFPQFCKHT